MAKRYTQGAMDEPIPAVIPPAKAQSKKPLFVVLIGLGVFLVAYVLMLKAYQMEGEHRSADVSVAADNEPNRVEVSAKIVTVDPIKGDMTVRLEFDPKGELTKDEGVTVTRKVTLVTNSANGKQEQVFAKGGRMTPVDVAVDLYDGQVMDYPFDEHSALLSFYLES